MATMKDIAKETGLGLATISKYLNGGHVLDQNKAAIELAIEKLGYTVNEFARGLKTSRSRTVGVVIPELSNVFITSIITIVEEILRRSGYAVIICDCGSDPQREVEAVRFLLGKQVDGIISMPVSKDGMHLTAAFEKKLPVVLIDRMIYSLKDKVSAVLVDNVGASSHATSLLLEAGHREVGIILGPQDVYTSQQRLLGYSQIMLANGLLQDASLVVYSDYSVQGGYESMKRLLRRPGMTAAFVTNYEMTLGAIIALNELGVQMPNQISLIGFDNQQLSRVIRPRLTIITQPLEGIGEAVAEILLTQLDEHGGHAPQVVTLSTDVLLGESIRKI
ncbi:LacI family DNA-binding transcriptional regulator [Oscillospiraceae bacterium MB08-C2-2]|nr:LacI family DNA-binding transcriptional regulator [Oscillospiraceae bacterium MB08-C2-2]